MGQYEGRGDNDANLEYIRHFVTSEGDFNHDVLQLTEEVNSGNEGNTESLASSLPEDRRKMYTRKEMLDMAERLKKEFMADVIPIIDDRVSRVIRCILDSSCK